MTRRIRWFWSLYTLVVTAVLVAAVAGPAAEARYDPVRAEQSITDLTRHGDRLCYTWISDKLKEVASDDLDARLDVDGDRLIVAPYNERTGKPWSKGGSQGVGLSRLRYCVALPPYVTAAHTLRLTQTAWYPSSYGPWRVPLVFPEIVSPGERP